MRKMPLLVVAAILGMASSVAAQDMPEMQMEVSGSRSSVNLAEQHTSAGTDVAPESTPASMLMMKKGSWTLMFHGQAFLSEFQQSGPRGRDKVFSTNWLMPMAQRTFSNGTLTFRTMLSLEPATVTKERYPELFQQGETAFKRPIVDGQHPHDFLMEIAAIYNYRLGQKAVFSFYAAPVGDPAMGPPAYPHRASASENPVAPLGHHLQDSTHIVNDVITAGISYRTVRLEASGFHGREPDEHRWNLDSGKIDSWSTRISANPGANWSVQYSIAQLHSPEELNPAEDVRRMTASLAYNRPLPRGNWASMLLWGRNQGPTDRNVGNSYLLESTLQFQQANALWTRIENVDRSNELLIGENSLPAGFSERYFARVQAYTVGYDREFGHVSHLSTAIGGQITWYGVPDSLKLHYGSSPVGGIIFLRVRSR